MATKLKRSLYIGLGGTGIKALLKTKKMIVDNYGEVPHMIQFLGFDSDMAVYGQINSWKGKDVFLTREEQCCMSFPSDPGAFYQSHIKDFDWLPSEKVRWVVPSGYLPRED